MKGTIDLNHSKHDFRKVNLVTTPKGDIYQCRNCKIKGYRRGLLSEIVISRCKKELFYNCTGEKEMVAYRLRVAPFVEGATHLKEGDIVNSCDCPKDLKKQFSHCIWVMGKVPFMVFPDEVEKVVPNT